MKIVKYFGRPLITCLVSLSFIFTLAVPTLVPALASAANITSRSIDLSSSAAAATNVEYTVTFTPVSNAAGYLLDFCDDTPIAGQTCTGPTGFSTAGVTTPTSSTTVQSLTSDSGVIVTKALTGGSPVTVVLDGLTNPTSPTTSSSSNGFYGRIVTYDTVGLAALTTSSDNTTLTSGNVDQGGVAMAITNAIGVSASVSETLTFCVSGSALGVDCSGATSPSLSLGVSVGNASALSSTTLSTGTVYTQITTNATSGAAVNLKSNATGCGGLIMAEDPSACNIGPAHSGDGATNNAAAGFAFFGLETAGSSTGTSGAADAVGSLAPVAPYSSSSYEMNYVSGDATGVTSTYGDPILNTAGAPANNQNMPLTFAASINNNTPAGDYSATLGLIASGTY